MPYPKAYGCCCKECSTSLFANGVKTSVSRLKFYPEGTTSTWDYTTDWGVTNPVFQHNDGFEETPPGSFLYKIPETSRAGAMDFKLSFRVYPVFKASDSSFVSKQIGAFVADAFVVWVDFEDRSVYWAPTDATGTIPESGTLVKHLGFNPAQMLVEVYVFRNEKGSWNLQFHDSVTDAVGLNINWLVEWDKVLEGLEPGPITFGGTTGEGGGGIGSLVFSCGSAQICNQCWDGLPMSWSVDFGDPEGDIAVLPTELANFGSCAAVASGLLDVSTQQAQVGTSVFGPVYLGTYPGGGLATPINFWFSLRGTLWFIGGNVTPDDADKIYLVASVDVRGGILNGRLGSVIVAAWTCPWESFCCYGRESTFTKERLFDDGTNFGGPSADTQQRYFEQFDGWREEVVIKSIGPPDDMPCTQTCVYRSIRDPITKKLVWELLQSSRNQHVFCPGDAPCPEPPMDPQKESQYVYLPCSE